MRRAALSVVAVAVAMLAQLMVINRLRLPGDGTPDLVLLAVVALAMCGGPLAGSVTGFCAGLSLDLAPPASQLVGEYALVFCLVGYGCGMLRRTLGRPASLSPPAVISAAAAAAAGEALAAGLALALSRGAITPASVRQVLPASVAYDVAISPFVLGLVVLAARLLVGDTAPGAAAEGQPGTAARLVQAPAAAGHGPGVGLASGTSQLGSGWLAQAATGPARQAGQRRPGKGDPGLRQKGTGWIGRTPRRPAPARAIATPNLAARGVAGSAARGYPSPAAPPGGAARLRLSAKRRLSGRAEAQRRSAQPRIGFGRGATRRPSGRGRSVGPWIRFGAAAARTRPRGQGRSGLPRIGYGRSGGPGGGSGDWLAGTALPSPGGAAARRPRQRAPSLRSGGRYGAGPAAQRQAAPLPPARPVSLRLRRGRPGAGLARAIASARGGKTPRLRSARRSRPFFLAGRRRGARLGAASVTRISRGGMS